MANWLAELVKLCITADLFGIFIQAVAKYSFSNMARNKQQGHKQFLPTPILTVISKLLYFKVGLL